MNDEDKNNISKETEKELELELEMLENRIKEIHKKLRW